VERGKRQRTEPEESPKTGPGTARQRADQEWEQTRPEEWSETKWVEEEQKTDPEGQQTELEEKKQTEPVEEEQETEPTIQEIKDLLSREWKDVKNKFRNGMVFNEEEIRTLESNSKNETAERAAIRLFGGKIYFWQTPALSSSDKKTYLKMYRRMSFMRSPARDAGRSKHEKRVAEAAAKILNNAKGCVEGLEPPIQQQPSHQRSSFFWSDLSDDFPPWSDYSRQPSHQGSSPFWTDHYDDIPSWTAYFSRQQQGYGSARPRAHPYDGGSGFSGFGDFSREQQGYGSAGPRA